MQDNLELRMYGLVPYNISPIQQGIQFGHAVVEYSQKIESFKHGLLSRTEHYKSLYDSYDNWAKNWKTFIILNGGTTNNKIVDGSYVGSLNNHKETLDKLGIFNVSFNEPDLGDQLTAIVFILDERIFNRTKYPDFDMNKLYTNSNAHTEWLKLIGGENNSKIREFISGFRLA
jgi:hypothetical protein